MLTRWVESEQIVNIVVNIPRGTHVIKVILTCQVPMRFSSKIYPVNSFMKNVMTTNRFVVEIDIERA